MEDQQPGPVDYSKQKKAGQGWMCRSEETEEIAHASEEIESNMQKPCGSALYLCAHHFLDNFHVSSSRVDQIGVFGYIYYILWLASLLVTGDMDFSRVYL